MAETQARIAVAIVRIKGDTKATREHLARFEQQVNNRFNRIEASINRLTRLHRSSGCEAADRNDGDPKTRKGDREAFAMV